MTLLANTGESGQANGTVVSTANSSGGDAFTDVSNTEITYQSTAALKGSIGFRHVASASVQSWVGWNNVAGATTDCALRVYFRFGALPTGQARLAHTRSSGGGTGLVNIGIDAAGKVWLGSDPSAATLGTSTATLSPNTVYRLEAGLSNPSSTTGVATVRVYLGDTATVAASLDLSGVNLGAAVAMGTARFGRSNSGAAAWSVDFDDVAFQTGSSALIGPSASNTAPTVNAGVDQTVEPWSTVTLTASASDPDGTTPTVTWAQAGGPAVTLSGSGAARTFAAPGTLAGATLTFAATASDGSLSASDSMTVTVLPATERAVIGGVEVPMRIRTS